MGLLTFRGVAGTVFMRDGAFREVSLTEDQTAALLDCWQEAGARETFLELYEACRDAGFIPRTHCLRLVSDNSPRAVVRQMLAASVEDLLAAQALESKTL